MAKHLHLLVLSFLVLALAATCKATTYTVGDSSGWDISTDLDTWAQDKKFVVGDVLSFQYASTESVSEVTKENYDSCNTTNVIQTSSTGNTTFTLTSPGDRYFISGNKLYCLGGMKLHVHVESNQLVAGPASAPQAESGGAGAVDPNPTSKSNNPSSVIPSSAVAIVSGGTGFQLFFAILSLVAITMFRIV